MASARNRRLRATAILLTLLAVPACSDPEPVSDAPQRPVAVGSQADSLEPARDRPTIRTNYQGEFAPVPSDSGASYRVLANDPLPEGTRDVVTRRDSRDGTDYARWEIDCTGASFRLLGEGVSVDRALDERPDVEAFAALAGAPIAADIAQYACNAPAPRALGENR